MNFIAIDTSADELIVVVRTPNGIIKHVLSDCARKHSERLVEEMLSALSEAHITLNDCDFFAAVVGPGSFTGVRIGIATIKGLCLALDKPALSVTAFDTVAYHEEGNVLVLIDAGHGNVYACGYNAAKEITLAPAFLTRKAAEDYASEGYKIVERKGECVAEGLCSYIEAHCDSFDDAEALTALYLRKSSAEY